MLPLVLTRFHDWHLKTGGSTELRKILEIGEIKIHDPKTTSGQVRLLTTSLGFKVMKGKTVEKHKKMFYLF